MTNEWERRGRYVCTFVVECKKNVVGRKKEKYIKGVICMEDGDVCV